jgi:hypothetical protein
VTIRRWNISGSGSSVALFDPEEGIDMSNLSLAPNQTTPGNIDVLFDPWDCMANDSDIYALESANTI